MFLKLCGRYVEGEGTRLKGKPPVERPLRSGVAAGNSTKGTSLHCELSNKSEPRGS